MKFTTEIKIQPPIHKINYSDEIISLGSCFAIHMAEKLSYFQFKTYSNPWGILFHPLAIEKLVEYTYKNHKFQPSECVVVEDIWAHLDAHSDMNALSSNILIDNLQHNLQTFKSKISEARFVMITYGTSWIYEHISENKIVANCHKIPQKQFRKRLLSILEIKRSIQNTISMLLEMNPALHFIFTISPVRHIKDGIVENQRSKALLLLALHEVVEENKDFCSYFPSYEIMIDELRDYRFYDKDMIHPNDIAVDWIWKHFSENYIDTNAFSTMKKVDEIRKGLAHRLFNPHSSKSLEFRNQLEQKTKELTQRFPFMQF